MSDEEASEITNAGEQKLEGDIEKEIAKLKYFLEETNEIIEAKDYDEMEAIYNRAGKIIVKISELISQAEELKIDNGKTTRTVRQWKKETKSKYSELIVDNEKIAQQLKEKQEKAQDEAELRRLELKDKQFQQEERWRAEIREAQEDRERHLWQEKHEAELRMTQRKIEMEQTARSSTAKLPKLKITPFNGTPTDWVRFENMFLTLVHEKASTAEEKYGFLLEMVSPKVREKIANLKPGEVGYLDTGSGRDFISREAVKKLNLNPTHHESHEIVTVTGTSTQAMPIFQTTINSLDGKVHEDIELTGSRLQNFTTVKRPDMNELKKKYTHMQDKGFYMTSDGEHPIHIILGDGTYSRIRTEKVYKGNPGDPLVEETTFGWVVHGGENYSSDACMYTREVNDYEQLYSLDVLRVEDRGENDQMQVLAEFRENITRQDDGRYKVSIPWIPGSKLTTTNEQQSRRRLSNVNKKLAKDENLKQEYEKIIEDQLASGVIEKAPDEPSGERVYYMPHKPVVRQDASTTKVRMVFDASSKPHPLASNIQKAFLQIAIKEEDRDAFRFLFDRDEKEEHFRFARVPFGVEASPFLLGATLEYHYDQQSPELEETVTALRENTYVDNIMQTGSDIDKLEKFKKESQVVLESARLPIHKWESNIEALEDENMQNPSKILGHVWDKRADTLEIQVPALPETKSVTKRSILSQLGKVYDPLGIISPTMAEGKHIYREACEEKKGWNAEVSPELKKQWHKWNKQLKNVEVPRSLTGNSKETKAIELHVFADASNLACSAVTIAVVEHSSGTIKGLLTSKSRISKRNTSIPRLELVGAHMAANMAKNLHNALKRQPIKTIVIWLNSMVVLYWLTNPGKPWKTFVSNRIKKIAEITSELGIVWKYCPSKKNLADLGSRGATMERLQNGSWFNGPDWLLEKEQWPEQPILRVTTSVSQECKPIKEQALFTKEREPDEWDALLERNTYWRTLRVTAWVLRFLNNCLAKVRRNQKQSGPLVSEEISVARYAWIRRVQQSVNPELQAPGWRIVEDKVTKVLKCKGRLQYLQAVFHEALWVTANEQHAQL
ncbi:uncharacterized protein LOC114533565 [Dendronephthya gigantea]|uniref:uncharacterized protein LOC114533565 n=1 Tax=Dendronephthya gigantea TaxID=151771 RepID=UPI0010691C95|nr:uncharacterized protein LOC114533565 [Dendronephthya gigantea]